MEGNNTPQNSPPVKYMDPKNHPNNSDHEDGLPSSSPDDSNSPDNPNDPDDPNGPDGGPDNEPNDDPNCVFLHALHDLSDSLRNLHQPQAAKPEKIKVREPDTFDETSPQKLQDFLMSCNLHFRDRSDVFTSDEGNLKPLLNYVLKLRMLME